MIRRSKVNKLESLKQSMINEKTGIETELREKYERGKKAVNELQGLAATVTKYVQMIREKGIDVDYIKNNAEQIHTIFFAVMELLENDAENRKAQEDEIEETDGASPIAE